VSVKEDDLKDEILTLLKSHAEVFAKGLAVLSSQANSDLRPEKVAEAKLSRIRQQIAKTEALRKSLYENLVSGVIDEAGYQSLKREFECDLDTLKESAIAAENAKFKRESAIREYHDMSDATNAAITEVELTAELIDKLIEKILVDRDKGIEIHFRFRSEFEEVFADA
jgi:hypothetical protein